MLENIIDNKIIPYVFKTSKHPMLFRELLEAIKLYNDGAKLESEMPGFKMRLARLYTVYLFIWHIVFLPFAIIIHYFLSNFDCHISIVVTALITIIFFGGYTLYKDFLIDRVANNVIKKAWTNHFPHFDYEQNSHHVCQIYSMAKEQGVSNKDLEFFVMDELAKV
jgi:hypothetical protein